MSSGCLCSCYPWAFLALERDSGKADGLVPRLLLQFVGVSNFLTLQRDLPLYRIYAAEKHNQATKIKTQ